MNTIEQPVITQGVMDLLNPTESHTESHIAKNIDSSHHNANGEEDFTPANKEKQDIPIVITVQDNTEKAGKARVTEDDQLKRETKAATTIQSRIRGIQARRNLYRSEIDTNQSWKKIIDFTRKEYIHKMDAKNGVEGVSPVDDTATSLTSTKSENKVRWAWRRAHFLGSKLGKGLASADPEKALVLLTEHWLEMSDKEHRYGSNLKHYHKYWTEQDTKQNFFYWLDYGEGKDVDLEVRPRAKLREQKVRYLLEHEREQYAVTIKDGLLIYKLSGEPVHTLPTDIKEGDDVDLSKIFPDITEEDDEATKKEKKRVRAKSKYIYVVDPKNVLYIAMKEKGKFHHSSFLGGATVIAAGGIIVNRGKLMKINPMSGHYRPEESHFSVLLEWMEQKGISMKDVIVSSAVKDDEPQD